MKKIKDNIWVRLQNRLYRYEREFPKKYNKGLTKILVFCVGELLTNALVGIFSLFSKKRTGRLSVAVRLYGGLGDHVINIPYVEAFARHFSERCDVELVSKLNKDCVRGIFGCNPEYFPKNLKISEGAADYDLTISLCCFPVIAAAELHRIRREMPSLFEYVDAVEEFAQKNTCFRREGTPEDSVAMEITQILGKTRFSQFSVARELPVSSKRFVLSCLISEHAIREKFTGGEPYITLQRGVQDANAATRCWSVEKYEAFVRAFKARFPHVKVIQLGAASTTPICGCDSDLRGKTSFEELKAVLKYGVFHFDGECGMVHLKHVLGGRSVVLFGPTSEKFKGYPENLNLSNRPCPHVCEWLTSDWQDRCLQTGTRESVCMNRLSPEYVLSAVEEEFGSDLRAEVSAEAFEGNRGSSEKSKIAFPRGNAENARR